jgi:CHAD domain-containing protein
VAYELKGRTAVARQLARVVATEFDKALEEVGGSQIEDRTEAVHEARKRVKKIRAVVRLLERDLGNDHRILNRQLRTIAHQLSSLRDVDAAVEMMESVRDRYPSLVTPPIFAAVQRGLLARKRGTVEHLHPDHLLPRVARELRRLAMAMPRRIRRVGGHASVRAGMLRAYRRARNAMASVNANPEDVRFHLWRRRVKDHWYHVRLFEGLNAHADARARGLKRLEAWLGDDHNLVLLRTSILSAPARFGDERTTAIVLGCVTKHHAALRKRALKLGARMFAGKPGVFRGSFDSWWGAGRRSQPASASRRAREHGQRKGAETGGMRR